MIDPLLACPYCGDTMDMPNEELLERFGQAALNCCEFKMITLDRGNLYKLLKGLDTLKVAIEHEITKDF
jgi:hypothetical protein